MVLLCQLAYRKSLGCEFVHNFKASGFTAGLYLMHCLSLCFHWWCEENWSVLWGTIYELTGLAGRCWLQLYVFDLCFSWGLGWYSGLFTNSVKVSYDFAVVALFVDCWIFGSIFVCLWAPAEEALRVVRLCISSRFLVLALERCSFRLTASGVEFVYSILV